MELECKVAVAHTDVDKLIHNLGEPTSIEYHENHFLDSPDEALNQNHSTLRLRMKSNSVLAQCTLKEDSQTMHGTCVRWSTHAEIPSNLALRVLQDPDELLNFSCTTDVHSNNSDTTKRIECDSVKEFALTSPPGLENPIASNLREKYGIKTLKYVGGFKTQRRNFRHPGSEVQSSGLRLKLDAVEFPSSSTYYELEVVGATVPISDVLDELCQYLKSIGVSYSMCEGSKYEIFQREKKESLMSCDIRAKK